MLTDGRKDARKTDEVITTAHPEHSSGELKNSRGDEREGQGRKRNRNGSKETE